MQIKLFSIISTFDNKEWIGFTSYILLYHKPHSVICKIASWLDTKSRWKDYRGKGINAEKLLSDFPHQIKLQPFLNAMSKLGNIAEEYVGWMVWRDSPNQKRTCQLIGLAQKSLSDEYLTTQKEVLKKPSNGVISIWEDYYRMRALFNDYYYGISASEDNHKQEFIDLIESFRKSTATIAQFLSVEIKNREKLLSESWDHQKEFFEFLYNNDTELVFITDKLIKMNYYGDVEAYNYLSDVLGSKKIDNFSLYIQYSIVTYCITFLIGKIKQGEGFRGKELLDLFEYSLEKGTYTINDKMPIRKYLNIIGVASKLKKYEWARKIVENWAHKVDEANSKSIAKFGQATIDFYQMKYHSVVDALSNMKSSNFQHRLRSRWLLLRAQYEINKEYIEVIKIQVDNFRRFIISNESRISKPTYDGLKSSIKILNMILNRESTEHIENYYRSSKYIFERIWILDKIKNPM